MTALDDAIAKADEVLEIDATGTAGEWTATGHSVWSPITELARCRDYNPKGQEDAALIASYRTAAPDLARALKAVAEALDEVDRHWSSRPVSGEAYMAIDDIRAAIERRLTEGK